MVRPMLREDALRSRGRTDRWPSRRQPSLKEGGAPSYDTDDRAEDEEVCQPELRGAEEREDGQGDAKVLLQDRGGGDCQLILEEATGRFRPYQQSKTALQLLGVSQLGQSILVAVLGHGEERKRWRGEEGRSEGKATGTGGEGSK